MTTSSPGVTGDHTANGRPNYFTSLTPFIAVTGAREALDFYRDIFGAEVIDVTEMNGHVVHAELGFDSGRLQLGEATPDYGLVPQSSTDDACFSFSLYTPDVDALVDRAVSAGATLREPVAYFASGDRYGSIKDPFGVRWTIMTRVEDLSSEDSARLVAEWAAQQEN